MAVRQTGLAIEICRVADGEQALAFLRRAAGYEIAPRPDVILLDLNLPRKNGLEVLFDISASDSLRSIPVVVFTSSSLATEENKALALGAQHYIRKPGTLNAMAEAVSSVCSHYLELDRGFEPPRGRTLAPKGVHILAYRASHLLLVSLRGDY